MTRHRLLLAALIGYTGFLEIFSILPSKESVGEDCRLCWDVGNATANFLHFVVYAGLAWIIYRYMESRGYPTRLVVIIAIFSSLAIGILNEFLQILVPGRSANVSDGLLDMLGGIAGAWLAYRTRKPASLL